MQLSTDDVVKIVGLLAAPAVPVISLGWWLRGQFNSIMRSAELRMQGHERQDERRHRQNLVRFARIGERLGVNFDLEEDFLNGNGGGETEH